VQVFLNLAENAVHAVSSVPPGRPRTLRIHTRIETDYHFASPRGGERPRPRGRFLRIDVEDDGPGIPDDARPKLFSPFFTTKSKGTGLGLAISHRIVTYHGGTIRFESEPGRTVFRVILPVADEDVPGVPK
jgi:two-component system nitrogen regulation sensor histidine kinase GlnL